MPYRPLVNLIRRRIKRIDYAKPLSSVLHIYLRFVYLTSKVTYVESDSLKAAADQNSSFIFAVWHDQIPNFLWAVPTWLKRPLSVMASSHRDGMVIRHTVESFGHKSLEYDKQRPHRSLVSIVKILKQSRHNSDKHALAITPDGPIGPRHKAKQGIFFIADRANMPIIPLTTYAKRHMMLNSWDKMQIPLPFNHIYVLWGDRFEIDPDQSQETQQHRLEIVLNTLSERIKTAAASK
ncbi:MAG: lysophospholipid acyltransferase family protein [Alphaproteobacteria bacterium]